jgi:hypothetical protein
MNSLSPLLGQKGEEVLVTLTGELQLVVRLRIPPLFRSNSKGADISPAMIERLSELAADPDRGVAQRAELLLRYVRSGKAFESAEHFNTTWEVLIGLRQGVVEHGPDWLLRFEGKRLKTRRS